MSIVSFVIYFQIYVEIRIRMRITVTTKLRDSDSDIFWGLFSPSQILPKLLLHVLSLPKLKSHADCCMAFLIHQITKRHLFKIKTYRHIKKKNTKKIHINVSTMQLHKSRPSHKHTNKKQQQQ